MIAPNEDEPRVRGCFSRFFVLIAGNRSAQADDLTGVHHPEHLLVSVAAYGQFHTPLAQHGQAAWPLALLKDSRAFRARTDRVLP